MGAYRSLGLMIVIAALAFIAGMRVGQHRSAQTQPAPAADGSCCVIPVNPAAKSAPKLAIPTGSGRSCLVEFGSDECDECQRMAGVLREVGPKLKGVVDLVQVDTDLYPGEAQRWQLRMVPVQILVDAKGKELWRHEGFIAAEELLARVAPTSTSRPGAESKGQPRG